MGDKLGTVALPGMYQPRITQGVRIAVGEQKQGPWVEQICDACARLLGGIGYGCSTYNSSNPCDVCGEAGVPVTEPGDWRIDLPIAEARRRRDLVFAKAEECEGV